MRRLLRRLFQRESVDDELREEMQFHLDARAELNQESGMSTDAAQESARRSFGNRTMLQEDTRRMHINQYLETIGQDLRYAIRSFRRNPAFTLTVLIVIAVGIGATSAVFSVVDRLLFRNLPYPDSDRLVSFGVTIPVVDQEFLFGATYVEWRRAESPFTSVTSWGGVVDCDLTEQNATRLGCARVESTFLPTFGIRPILGRNFTSAEDRPNGPKVALLSYSLWQGRFGGDPGVIGRSVSLDGQSTEIIGVLPRDFEVPTLTRADLVVPQEYDDVAFRRNTSGFPHRCFGRLKPGVTVEQAQAQLMPKLEEGLKTLPAGARKIVHLVVRFLRDYQIQNVKLASWILLASVITILLIACANIANLLLARAASRQREMAVRTALGAGRTRLIRQTLTESLLLGFFGGIAGCGFAWLLLHGFKLLAPTSIPRLAQASLDLRVLLFTLAASLLCGLMFGLAPALSTPRAETLTSRTASSSSRHSLRHVLTTVQVGLSLILLSVGGLLLQSLWKLQNVSLGLAAENVITTEISLSPQRYSTPVQRQQFFTDLEARLHRLPGVTAVALSDTIPPGGFVHTRPSSVLQVQGQPTSESSSGGIVAWRLVTPEYFKALGIPIRRGRSFQETDRSSRDNLIILSSRLARQLFPNEDPLNRVIHFQPNGPDCTVIGIASDVKNNGLAKQPDPEYYLVRKQITDPNTPSRTSVVDRTLHWYDGDASLIIRSSATSQAVSTWIRTEVASLDATLPITIKTLKQQVHTLSERPRFNAFLLTLFAVTGLLLAASGLYGLISFLVAQRTQEIGVRMALGATPGNIAKLVLSHAARWTIAGALLGVAGSLATTRMLGSMLFQVPARDPVTLCAALLLLLIVALVAAWIPSRRAASVDPMRALRQE